MINNSKFKILEHKADLKIQAFGRTKEELFLNMLKGMASVLGAEIKDKKKGTKSIEVSSIDLGALLVDFLNEVLYLSQTNKEIYIDFKIKEFKDYQIKGKLIGQKIVRFKEDIKAATYHGLDVQQRKNKTWTAIVLFDI